MFSKEILLNKISTMGDFETIQYISTYNFGISLISVWLVTVFIFLLITLLSKKHQNYLLAFAISMTINLILTVLIVLGFIPALLSIS